MHRYGVGDKVIRVVPDMKTFFHGVVIQADEELVTVRTLTDFWCTSKFNQFSGTCTNEKFQDQFIAPIDLLLNPDLYFGG